MGSDNIEYRLKLIGISTLIVIIFFFVIWIIYKCKKKICIEENRDTVTVVFAYPIIENNTGETFI